jgi:hypothetical protein
MSLPDDNMPSFPHRIEYGDSVFVQLTKILFAVQKDTTLEKKSGLIGPTCHIYE